MKIYTFYKRMSRTALFALPLLACFACSDMLNIVPDNISTVEMAFQQRKQTEKYLFTCYSYMPKDGDYTTDPGIFGGDELWTGGNYFDSYAIFQIAKGGQNAESPIAHKWYDYYQALRDCNIFLENIGNVPDLQFGEFERWSAEVTFLKAYYHFLLLRQYGPVPIIYENVPVGASVADVKPERNSVDECVDYIIELIDKAIPDLELIQENPQNDLGRVTRAAAASIKAKVLVYAASPLFNGNTEQATLKNEDGKQLFNQSKSDIGDPKWERAMKACREALEICNEAGMRLYTYGEGFDQYGLTDIMKLQLSIRNAFAERWNSELIWGNSQTSNLSDMIRRAGPYNLNGTTDGYAYSNINAPLKMPHFFYTKNGVPWEDDLERLTVEQTAVRVGTAQENLYIVEGYTTAEFNFDREPRFYATLGFDGGVWYGAGSYQDKDPSKLYSVKQRGIAPNAEYGPYTGYYIKKWAHYTNYANAQNSQVVRYYPWPIMRLPDLYLLYAEAINEYEGPNGPNSATLFSCIDIVRKRAGLEGVKASWDKYAVQKKYSDQTGMREIIQRERTIELMFEGQRFWDVRRWKIAPAEYDKPVQTWNLMPSDAELFYNKVTTYSQKFRSRDYFWPIKTSDVEQNPKIVQNIGW